MRDALVGFAMALSLFVSVTTGSALFYTYRRWRVHVRSPWRRLMWRLRPRLADAGSRRDEHAYGGVLEDVAVLRDGEAVVQRDDHGAHGRHGEEALEVAVPVGHQRGDAIASLHADGSEPAGESPAARRQLPVCEPHVAVGDDELVPVELLGPTQCVGDQLLHGHGAPSGRTQ